MISPHKIKNFWESRGKKYHQVAFESVANLEEDPELLELKISVETNKVIPRLALTSAARLLDLGAGCGQWSFRFAPLVKEVTAVEYTRSLAEIGIKEALRRQASNVHFEISPAEEFKCDTPYDIVFISGLFVYLTDKQAEALCGRLRSFVTDGGQIFVRDGTSILNKRYQIENKYSPVLQTEYSAIYRTTDEYLELLDKADFICEEHGNIFDEGCALNKYPETRLRWYSCRPKTSTQRG